MHRIALIEDTALKISKGQANKLKWKVSTRKCQVTKIKHHKKRKKVDHQNLREWYQYHYDVSSQRQCYKLEYSEKLASLVGDGSYSKTKKAPGSKNKQKCHRS